MMAARANLGFVAKFVILTPCKIFLTLFLFLFIVKLIIIKNVKIYEVSKPQNHNFFSHFWLNLKQNLKGNRCPKSLNM